MKNTKLAANKLRMAMSGLKAAYHDASPADRKVIVATMKEVQAIHNQLVTAAEDDVEEDVEDMEVEAEDDMAEGGDDESADDMAMDEMAEEDAAAGMNMDDAHMSESDMMDDAEMAAPADDMAPLSMDDMDMSDMDMSEGEEPVMNVDGLDIPEEFVGDLGDLGLLEMGEVSEDGEDVDADEELAVAALALAANALKMLKAESDEEDDMLIMMHETPEDEPESSQEEDESAEVEEHKATKRGEQLHGSRRQASAVRAKSVKPNDTDLAVRKLREISARLSSVRAPVKALMLDITQGGELVVSREQLEEMGASSDSFLDQAPYTVKLIEDLKGAAEKMLMPLDLYDGHKDSQIFGIYNAGGRLKLVAEVKGGKVVQFRGRHNRLPTEEEHLIAKAAWGSSVSASVRASTQKRGMREVLAPLARRPTRGR